MTDMKYIVVSTKADDQGMGKMITFDPSLNHADMAKAMERQRYPFVISAGFINEFLECYGESMTCRVKSRPDIDTIMLHTLLKLRIKIKD